MQNYKIQVKRPIVITEYFIYFNLIFCFLKGTDK